MREFFFLFIFCSRVIVAGAQAQELEQLKINLEKLAQLKLLLSQTKQGYQSLQDGYNAVRDAAKGNYELHKNHLDGLLQVSQPVKNAPALKRLIYNSALMPKEFRGWYNQVQGTGLLQPKELADIRERYRLMETAMHDLLDQVQLLLAPGSLRMSDAERIAALEMLALKSDELMSGLRQLIKEQTVTCSQRAQDKKDASSLRRQYGLH